MRGRTPVAELRGLGMRTELGVSPSFFVARIPARNSPWSGRRKGNPGTRKIIHIVRMDFTQELPPQRPVREQDRAEQRAKVQTQSSGRPQERVPAAGQERAVAAPQWRRILAALVCSLGGAVFGFDLGALSGATRGLAGSYPLSPTGFGLTVSASLWGAVCASPIAGELADRFGRRGLLAGCALLYALCATALGLPVAWPWSAVIVLRVLCGFTIGGFVVGCPLYLAEIAPSALRGRFVGLFQFQIGAGAVLAFAVSAVLARQMVELSEWKWCFGLGAIPPVCLLLLLHWMPEEPHWLLKKGRVAAAAVSARRLGLGAAEWQPGDPGVARQKPAAVSERLFQRRYRRALLLAASIALFNQLCGVTVLRVYVLDLLVSTGMGRSLSHRYGVILACMNLAALLLGMMIVDKIGRRPLLMIGSMGMAVCLLALVLRQHAAASFYLVTLAAYNTFFACSQGVAAWAYLSEIFPFPVRAKGQGFGALVHWISNASLIWLFPIMDHWIPRSSFMLFAAAMIVQVLVIGRWYPETKGTQLGMAAEASAQ